MALPSTEIRYGKAVLYFIVGMFAFFLLTTIFITFFTSGNMAGPSAYLRHFAFIVIPAFVCFRFYRQFSNPRPVLIFNSDGLHIPGKKNRYIYWNEITEWTIRTHKNSSYLVICTSGNKTRVDISWLELPAKQIRQLMERYIRRPGPDFAYN